MRVGVGNVGLAQHAGLGCSRVRTHARRRALTLMEGMAVVARCDRAGQGLSSAVFVLRLQTGFGHRQLSCRGGVGWWGCAAGLRGDRGSAAASAATEVVRRGGKRGDRGCSGEAVRRGVGR